MGLGYKEAVSTGQIKYDGQLTNLVREPVAWTYGCVESYIVMGVETNGQWFRGP